MNGGLEKHCVSQYDIHLPMHALGWLQLHYYSCCSDNLTHWPSSLWQSVCVCMRTFVFVCARMSIFKKSNAVSGKWRLRMKLRSRALDGKTVTTGFSLMSSIVPGLPGDYERRPGLNHRLLRFTGLIDTALQCSS